MRIQVRSDSSQGPVPGWVGGSVDATGTRLFPLTQTDDVLALTALELVPVGQALHALVPAPVWNVPGVQGMHAVMPVPGE